MHLKSVRDTLVVPLDNHALSFSLLISLATLDFLPQELLNEIVQSLPLIPLV